MEIVGILVRKVGEREGISQRNGQPWKTAEFLVEVPGQYPRHINFSVRDGQTGRIAHFDSLIGKTVRVSFDIDAHEYEGRWFNEIGAWGIMEYAAVAANQAAQAAQNAAVGQSANGGVQTAPAGANQTAGTQSPQNANDDLPF